MSARTGEEYITGLKEHPREVWIDGEQVQDVTTHPALRNGGPLRGGPLRYAT